MEKINMSCNEMKSDEDDQISKMLGHSDTIRLFDDEQCYETVVEHKWPSPISASNSVVEMTHTNLQPTRRCCSQSQRFPSQQPGIGNYSSPNSCDNSYCNSEMCPDEFSKNTYTNNSSSGTFSLNPITRQVIYKRLCLFSILIAFILGVLLGILIPFLYITKDVMIQDSNSSRYQSYIVINKPVNTTAVVPENNSMSLQYEEYSKANSLPGSYHHSLEKKTDYIKSKLDFPTIHDVKYKHKVSTDKPKNVSAVKLNKPKNFHSVSFVEDLKDNFENNQNVSIPSGPTTKDTLLKYLDLGSTNETENFFNDFGKKILESNLDETPTEFKNKQNDTILHNHIFWGTKVEKSLPSGFGPASHDHWMKYVKSSSAIKMESGCGRMQNRLVTFIDGTQACVRYRQNTDQIQGELFSFYLAQLLQLPNLAPSLVSVVNLTDPLWHNVATDIGSAQWNSNRPVVMTKYISNLEAAHIPMAFKPSERHLNKFDIFNIVQKGTDKPEDTDRARNNALLNKITVGLYSNKVPQIDMTDNGIEDKPTKHFKDSNQETDVENPEHLKANIGDALLDKFIELAQWSDLIIFDYLTANLDRIVNNLYNFQWNINIMDAPAHNLARKVDSNLLLFLDNESGLLHGYRLLHKYEVYHSSLLDSLCVFRKTTADVIKSLHEKGNVGDLMNKMFKDKNDANVLDVLPPLPEKSIKILKDRIARVAGRIKMCEEQYGR